MRKRQKRPEGNQEVGSIEGGGINYRESEKSKEPAVET
jgi:hypothetical protein